MDDEITSSAMQRLLGVGKVVLDDLAKRGIVVRGGKRGTYKLEPSVPRYVSHLREMSVGRGGDDSAAAMARVRPSAGYACRDAGQGARRAVPHDAAAPYELASARR